MIRVYRTFKPSEPIKDLIELLPCRLQDRAWNELGCMLDFERMAGISFFDPEYGQFQEMEFWQVVPDGASPEWFLDMLEATGLGRDPKAAWERLPWRSEEDEKNYFFWQEQLEAAYSRQTPPDPEMLPDGPPPYQGVAYTLHVEQEYFDPDGKGYRPVFRRSDPIEWYSPEQASLGGLLEVVRVRNQAGKWYTVAANETLVELFEQQQSINEQLEL